MHLPATFCTRETSFTLWCTVRSGIGRTWRRGNSMSVTIISATHWGPIRKKFMIRQPQRIFFLKNKTNIPALHRRFNVSVIRWTNLRSKHCGRSVPYCFLVIHKLGLCNSVIIAYGKDGGSCPPDPKLPVIRDPGITRMFRGSSRTKNALYLLCETPSNTTALGLARPD